MDGKVCAYSPTIYCVSASKSDNESKIENVWVEERSNRDKSNKEKVAEEGEGELSARIESDNGFGKIHFKKRNGKESDTQSSTNGCGNHFNKMSVSKSIQETIFYILGLPVQSSGLAHLDESDIRSRDKVMRRIKPVPAGNGIERQRKTDNCVRKDGDENKRRKALESNRKEDLRDGIKYSNKRQGKKKDKEEIIISPYFKKNMCSEYEVNPTTFSGEGGESLKRVEKKETEEDSYFLSKCVNDTKGISQLDENTQTKSAKLLDEIDVKNSQNMKNERRKDGNGDEVVPFSNGDEVVRVIRPVGLRVACLPDPDRETRPCKIEKLSIDGLFSRFAYTGGKLHKNPAKPGIHQSLSNKTETSLKEGKVKIVKDVLVEGNAPLLTAHLVGSQNKSCEINVEKGNGTEIKNVEISTQRAVTKGARKRVRVVSPYFANADTQVKLMTKQLKTESNKLHVRKVSPYFCSPCHKEENASTSNSMVRHRKTKRSKARAPTLTAAQKRDEAYQRKTPDNTWIPPRSPFNLLQEDHAFDPWRVLVICMLLKLTTGLYKLVICLHNIGIML